MKKIGIYKITNILNNRCYIGQSVDIDDRWYKHKWASYNEKASDYNYSIHKAIRKYGIDNFQFEIIELCDVSDLEAYEIFWISYYDSYNNGYNETPGGNLGPIMPGESNPNAKLTEEDVYLIRSAVLQCLPQKQFFEKNNLSEKISYRQFCRVWRGEGWEHILPEAIVFVKSEEYLHQIRKNSRALANTEQQKNYWKDIEDRKLQGETRSQVYDLYKGIYTQGGFDSIWYKIKENTKPLRRSVVKLDKKTSEELEIYPSAAEAGRKNNCDSSSIIKVCKGTKNSCGGYKWKYGDSSVL